MSFMKKCTSVLSAFCLVTLCMILCTEAVSAKEITASGICGDTLTWTLYDNNELVIEGEGAMDNNPFSQFKLNINVSTITIKSGVTTIGNSAFSSFWGLTKVSLPDTLTTIGDGAFAYCDELYQITIPDSVTTIGKSAFYHCWGLGRVTMSNRVTEIGDSAFAECLSLSSMTIPATVVSIGTDAFQNCYSLPGITVDPNNPNYSNDDYGVLFNKNKTVLILYPVRSEETFYSIPEGVISISERAFSNCFLSDLEIPATVTSIGDDAFIDCAFKSITVDQGNASYSSDEAGALFNKDKTVLIQYPVGRRDTSYTVPDSVTTIADSAFASCNYLTSVTLGSNVAVIEDNAFNYAWRLTSIDFPDSVVSVGESAFINCSSLTSISIGKQVSSIGENAFKSCKSLTKITVDAENSHYFSDMAGVLFNKDQTVLIMYPANHPSTSYTVPNGVITIKDQAFYGTNMLTEVVLPNTITSIGNNAFCSCDGIISIIIPESVTSIGTNAFYVSDGLTSVTILSRTAEIGKDVFERYNTSGLTLYGYTGSTTEAYAAEYGYHFEALSDDIASGVCGDNLTWVISTEGVLTISGTGDMYDYTGDCSPWSLYSSQIKTIVFEEGVTSIGKNAFMGINATYSALSEVRLSNTITSIKASAFSLNLYLKSIVIPDSVTEIGEAAFMDCDNLASVTFGKGLKTIGNNAFDCCPLTEILLPDGLEFIGTHAFSNNNSLLEVDIPEGVTHIGTWAFVACDNLSRVSIPSTVVSMEKNPFCINKSLAELTVHPDNPSFCSEDNALYSKDKTILYAVPGTLTGPYRIANTVTTVADCVFYNHTGITCVIFPDSVDILGGSQFTYAESLTEVYFEGETPEFGKDVFNYRTKITAYYPAFSISWMNYVIENGSESNNALWKTYAPEKGSCGKDLIWSVSKDGTLTISGTGDMYPYDTVQTAPWSPASRNIKKIVIENGVTSVGEYALASYNVVFGSINYSNLTEIHIGETVTRISPNAFGTVKADVYVMNSSTEFCDNSLVCSTIYGYTGSTAAVYAALNNISFVPFDPVETEPVETEPVETEPVETVEPEVTFTLSNAAAKAGSTVEISLTVSSKVYINSIALYELAYDPNVFTFVGFVGYEDFENSKCAFPNCFDSDKMIITIPLKQSEELCGTVCKLIFEVNENAEDGSSEISMTSLVKNYSQTVASTVNHATVTVTNQLLGDITGDDVVDITDAMRLFQYSMLPSLFPISYQGNLDFTKDGVVDISDAMRLFQYSMLPNLFPIG